MVKQVESIADNEKSNITVKADEKNASLASAQLKQSLKQGSVYLTQKDFVNAKTCFDNILDLYPKCSQAYLGYVMAEQKVTSFSQLATSSVRLSEDAFFKRAKSFAEDSFKAKLEGIQKENDEYLISVARKKVEALKPMLSVPQPVNKVKSATIAQPSGKNTDSEVNPDSGVKTDTAINSANTENVAKPLSQNDLREAKKSLGSSDNKKTKKSNLPLIIGSGVAAIVIIVLLLGKGQNSSVLDGEPVEPVKVATVSDSVEADNTEKTVERMVINPTDAKPIAFKILDKTLEMIPCPTGTFVMGSESGEDDEIPHKVSITKLFYISRYEITQGLFEDVAFFNPSSFVGADDPVDSVIYKDAVDFCNRLNEATKDQRPEGYVFDLPTEAQWEYACRAGTTTDFNNGKDMVVSKEALAEVIQDICWCGTNSFGSTQEVGKKQPNAWGIYDMHGNVYEWCRDNYQKSLVNEITDPLVVVDWANDHVIRGGCWKSIAATVRSSDREYRDADEVSNSQGIRVILRQEDK